MFHKRLLREFKENRKYVAGMVLTQWLALLANVVLMFTAAGYIACILDGNVSAADTVKYLIVFAVTFLVRACATTGNSRLSFLASSLVKERLREMIYKKLSESGTSYRETAATSEIVQIGTEGVDQLEIYFGKYVPQFFYSLLAPVTLFVITGSMSLKAAAVLLACVPLIPVSIVAVQKFAKKMLRRYWGTYTEMGDTFLEGLQGLTTLKIYQADERFAEKMDEEAEKFRKVTMRVLVMQLNSISVMDLVAYGGAAAGMILSVLELRSGHITLAECFFILMISAEFFLPLRLLGSFFHIAMNGNAAADKIFKLLDSPIRENGSIQSVPGSDIRFEHVDFSYTAERRILKDVSFEIPEHQFTALVGTSGCGKSTVASLIMGDYRIDEEKKHASGAAGKKEAFGKILLGGIETKEIDRKALSKKITRVRHDSYIFAGTVLENLKMGNPNAGVHEMEEALKQVDLYDTVMEKGGLTMHLSEKGANLSGGQKQRLVLARAILHNSDIYIFDEATSNIDVESENKIMEVVRSLAKEKTVILISHRLANVIQADRIFVMKDGAFIEQGVHSELMEQKGYYSSLYAAQQELEGYGKGAVS